MKIANGIWMAALLLSATGAARADATADLWTALKSANDPAALAAIAKGANVKKPDATGATPLHVAACFSGPEVVKALIDAKSDINAAAPGSGYRPIFNAANWGNEEAVKLLLAAGADVKTKATIGQPVLAAAMGSNKLSVIKLLVDAGADPKETWKLGTDFNLITQLIATGYSPSEKVKNLASNYKYVHETLGLTYPARLMNAKESDFTDLEEITKYLLAKGGFDPSQRHPAFGSVLGMAVLLGKSGVALALIDAKADTEVQVLVRGKLSSLRATPIMVAAMKGDNAVVERLIKAGAKINAIGTEVKSESTADTRYVYTTTWTLTNTALSLATSNNHPDTAEILRKAGGTAP